MFVISKMNQLPVFGSSNAMTIDKNTKIMSQELNKKFPDKNTLKKSVMEIQKTIKPFLPTYNNKSSFGSSGSNYSSLIIIAIAVFLFFYLKKKYFNKLL